MNSSIGDILDCRKVPEIGHFVLALGQSKKRDRDDVMYYLITSRVYTVFSGIIDFFNECLSRRYAPFLRSFPKENQKNRIAIHGRLCDAFFLDRESNYKGCLDVDSMIVVNENPRVADSDTFKLWRTNGMAIYRSRLTKDDLMKFIDIIKNSPSLSGEVRSYICRNYNEYKKVAGIAKT